MWTELKWALAWPKHAEGSRDYLSLKLDDPTFNVAPCATLLDR
jgi:uncharacterized protein (DUF736 family)